MKLEKETALYNENAIKNDINEAKSNSNYFWFNGTGDYKGAHITEIPESDFKSTPSGGNVWIESNEISLRKGTTKLYYSTVDDHPVLFYRNQDSFTDSGLLSYNSGNEIYSFDLPSNCDYLYDFIIGKFEFRMPGISSFPIVSDSIIFKDDKKSISLYNGGTNKKVFLNILVHEAGSPGDEYDEPGVLVYLTCESGLNNYNFEITWRGWEFHYRSKDPSSNTVIGYGTNYGHLLSCQPFSNSSPCFTVSHDGTTNVRDLYLRDHSDPIGTIYYGNATDSIAYGSSVSAGWKHLRDCAINVSGGTYLVNSMVRIEGTVSGEVYGLAIGYRQNDSNNYYGYSRTSFKGTGSTMQFTTQYISSIKYSIEFHPAVYIGSGGSNVEVTNRMTRAVRIV